MFLCNQLTNVNPLERFLPLVEMTKECFFVRYYLIITLISFVISVSLFCVLKEITSFPFSFPAVTVNFALPFSFVSMLSSMETFLFTLDAYTTWLVHDS